MKKYLFFLCILMCLTSINVFAYQTGDMNVDGVNRTLLYEYPDGDTPADGWPVLFLFHGAGEQGVHWWEGDRFKDFKDDALSKGYFVVAPDALWRDGCEMGGALSEWETYRWNLDDIPVEPTPPSTDYGNNDINFIYWIIWIVENSSDLNEDQVYMTGFSSGAGITMYAAYAFTSSIKAASINSGGYPDNFDLDLPTSGHPPMMVNHGFWDPVAKVRFADNYYDDLINTGIDTDKNINYLAGHNWLYGYDDDVFDWFEDHSL